MIDLRQPVHVPGGAGASDAAPFWAKLREVCTADGARPGVFYHLVVNRMETRLQRAEGTIGRPQLRNDPCRTLGIAYTNYTVTYAAGAAAGDTVTFPNAIDGRLDLTAHVVAHHHGSRHIGCGGQAHPLVWDFPYEDGSIGVQGYRFSTNQLMNVGEWHELMTPCYEHWISDWQYGKLYEATFRYTMWSGLAPKRTRPQGRSMLGYLGARSHEGFWFMVPGKLTDGDARLDPSNYAQVRLQGRSTGLLPITVSADSEGSTLEVVFTLPDGVNPDSAAVTVQGIRREIDMARVRRE
ncbi:MAG: hypothetical protein MJD61_19030 [Proteobacteria bacterium]|nr:hypothetical protein [Pseudomonadota bacterium]